MRMTASCASRIWGGTKLFEKFGIGCKNSCEPIGEAWVLSAYNDCMMSFVKNGRNNGSSLNEILPDQNPFPILIKLIDAKDDLSVQVHPDDEFAVKYEQGSSGKSELWYIIEAEPESEIVYGFANNVDLEKFGSALKRRENIDSMLNKVRVSPGDCFYIPAGLVHAIGKGILLAEVQQNSDLTYRLYDYNRKDINGNFRDLHIDKALSVLKKFTDEEILIKQYENGRIDDKNCLACTSYFTVNRYDKELTNKRMHVEGTAFDVIMLIDGEMRIIVADNEYKLLPGECVLLTSDIKQYTAVGNNVNAISISV